MALHVAPVLLRRTRAAVAQELLQAVGGRPERITGVVVTELAKAGDPASRELLEEDDLALESWLDEVTELPRLSWMR